MRPPRHARTNARDAIMREACPDCGAPLLTSHEHCAVCSWHKAYGRRVSSKRTRQEIVSRIAARFDAGFYADERSAPPASRLRLDDPLLFECIGADFLHATRLRTLKLPKGISWRDDGSAQYALQEAIYGLGCTDGLEEAVRHRQSIVDGTRDPDERERRQIGEWALVDSSEERAKKRAAWLARAQAELAERERVHRHLVSVTILGRTTCDAPGPNGLTCHDLAGHLSNEHEGYDPTPRDDGRLGKIVTWTTCTFPVGGCCRKHKLGGTEECLSWSVYNGRATTAASTPSVPAPEAAS